MWKWISSKGETQLSLSVTRWGFWGKHLFFLSHFCMWREKKGKKGEKKGKKMYLFIWGTIRDRCRGRIFLCWNEELASANEPGIYSEEQNLSQSPVVKQDGDGCLSAELSNLRGHFETRWEGLGFLLKPFSEHFYLLQWVAMAPPSQRREGGNSRNTGRLQQIKSCHWEQITTHLDNF